MKNEQQWPQSGYPFTVRVEGGPRPDDRWPQYYGPLVHRIKVKGTRDYGFPTAEARDRFARIMGHKHQVQHV